MHWWRLQPNHCCCTKRSNPCGLWAGKAESNYVYKITKYDTVEKKEGCPYFQSKGCWSDIKPWFKKMDARPMEKYALNERDPYASNWNGRLINWGKWGQGYLAGLLCRCADIAKKEGKKYFSIQFYGKNLTVRWILCDSMITRKQKTYLNKKNKQSITSKSL